MTTQTKIALGILGAAALGAAIGILLAPDKGSNTRKNIADTACDWADKFGNMIETGKEKLGMMKGQKANSVTPELS